MQQQQSFHSYRDAKSAGTCINVEKMQDARPGKFEVGGGKKRKRRREATDERQRELRVLRQERQ